MTPTERRKIRNALHGKVCKMTKRALHDTVNPVTKRRLKSCSEKKRSRAQLHQSTYKMAAATNEAHSRVASTGHIGKRPQDVPHAHDRMTIARALELGIGKFDWDGRLVSLLCIHTRANPSLRCTVVVLDALKRGMVFMVPWPDAAADVIDALERAQLGTYR